MDNYEQKYKQALKEVQELYKVMRIKSSTDALNTVTVLKEVFPELAEAEDERIRKEIVRFIQMEVEDEIVGNKWLAWLEKQGEQKPFDYEHATITQKDFATKQEPKFHEGEWIVWQNQCYKVNYNGCGYELILQNGLSTSLEYETVDTSAHLWDITQDVKDGDVLQLGDVTAIFQEYIGNGNCKCYCSVCNGEFEIPSQDGADNSYGCHNAHPATNEQRDQLEKAMADAGYTFDFEKIELKKIEDEEYNGEDYGIDSLYHAQRILEKTLGEVEGYQSDDGILEHKCAITAVKKLYKQKTTEWSEEDKGILNRIYQLIAQAADEHAYSTTCRLIGDKECVELQDWLRTLKERLI